MSSQSDGVALRVSAAQINRAVVTQGRDLDHALAIPEAQVAHRDTGLLKAMVFGMLRWHHRLQWQFEALIGQHKARRDPLVAALVRCGLFQIQYLRVPDHAAVAATVEAARRAGRPGRVGLINALLRRYLREAAQFEPPPEKPAAYFSHPLWLVEILRQDWPQQWREVLAANNQPAPMWLRVNRRRATAERYLQTLTESGIGARPVAEAGPDALLLEEPIAVDDLPGFAQGAVSVQDGAAQLACGLLHLAPGLRVLDACAAPGGKSAHILERFPQLELLAIDRSPTRLALMADGFERLGLSEVQTGVWDAEQTSDWWDGTPFDRILLDAPCTATGVVRRHPDIKVLRQPDDVARARAQQSRLLQALWPLLAPGGRLVYSTCSVLRDENQSVVADFLGRESAARPAAGAPQTGRQILPGEANMDGFYYACLEKVGD